MSGRCGDVAASLQAWVNFRILYPWEDKEASGKKFPPPSKCNLQKSLPCCCLCKLYFPFLSPPFFHGTLSLSLSFRQSPRTVHSRKKVGFPTSPILFLSIFPDLFMGKRRRLQKKKPLEPPPPVCLIYFSVVGSKQGFSFLFFLFCMRGPLLSLPLSSS